MKTRAQRFMDKVQINAPDECWLWTGTRNNKGYGQFWNGKKNVLAHRYMVNAPDGMEACHHCDNPPCVNPRHIFIGTRADNMRDGYRKGRIKSRITEFARNRKTWHKGENNHASRLTTEQAMLAKSCPSWDGAANAMAKAFKVHVSVIYGIKAGKRWAWLPSVDHKTRDAVEAFCRLHKIGPFEEGKK